MHNNDASECTLFTQRERISCFQRTAFDLRHSWRIKTAHGTWSEALLCGSYINVKASQFHWLSFFLVMRVKFEFHILDKNETSYQFILYAANMELVLSAEASQLKLFQKRSEHKFLALPWLCLNTHKTEYRTQGFCWIMECFLEKNVKDFCELNAKRISSLPSGIADSTHPSLAANEREGNVFYFNV